MKRSILLTFALLTCVDVHAANERTPLTRGLANALYCRLAGTCSIQTLTVTGSCTGCGGGAPFVDTTSIVEGSVDATKEIRFEVDGLTTGTIRIITPPDSNTSLPAVTQTITITGPTAPRTWTVRDAAISLVDGSTGATDNTILRADGTGGSTVQNSSVLISDTGWLSGDGGKCYVTADRTNATDTLATTTCTISNLVSSTRYSFTCEFFVADSQGVEGFQVDFAGGTATETNFRAQVNVMSDAGLLGNTQLDDLTDTAAASTDGATAFEINGSFEPSSNGTFLSRFAQSAHLVGTATLFRGSNCRMWVMP